jgi:flavodoxin
LVTRRGKTHQVADHSTTQSDQRRVSTTVIVQQGIKYELQGAYILVLFTIWQYLAAQTPVFQGSGYPIQIKRCHPVIADNDDLITRKIG